MFFLHIYKPQHKIQASHFIINRTIYIPLKSAREQFPEHLHTRKKRKKVCMRNVQQKMFLTKIRNRFQLTNFITSMCWKSWKGAHIQAYETPKEEILTAEIKLGCRWVAYLKQTATHTIHSVFQVRWSQNVQNLQIYPPKVLCTGLKKYPQDEHARKLKHDQRHWHRWLSRFDFQVPLYYASVSPP